MNSSHPVRRCAPCDRDWPSLERYNLCPRCQRCTFASTAERTPDRETALKDSARYELIRKFDAECDAAAAKRAEKDTLAIGETAWAADMHALFGSTALDNAQDVRHFDA